MDPVARLAPVPHELKEQLRQQLNSLPPTRIPHLRPSLFGAPLVTWMTQRTSRKLDETRRGYPT